jgi:hypothetical protein
VTGVQTCALPISKEFFQNLNGIGYIFKLFCMEESFVPPEAVTEPLAKKSLAQF